MIRFQKGHDEANAAVKRLLHLLGEATQGDGRDIYAKIAANGGGGDGAAVIINATEAGSMRPALKTAEAVGELAVGRSPWGITSTYAHSRSASRPSVR